MAGSAGQYPEAWKNDVIERLSAMIARKEAPLVSIVQRGNITIILIDRRLPAGQVVVV